MLLFFSLAMHLKNLLKNKLFSFSLLLVMLAGSFYICFAHPASSSALEHSHDEATVTLAAQEDSSRCCDSQTSLTKATAVTQPVITALSFDPPLLLALVAVALLGSILLLLDRWRRYFSEHFFLPLIDQQFSMVCRC